MVLQKVDDKKAEGTPSAFRHFAQIGRPLTGVGGRNFIITHLPPICQEEI